MATSAGIAAVLTSRCRWPLLVLGLSALASSQQSYRLARLSASMAVHNVVIGIVALGFGLVAFSEVPQHSPLFVAVEV